LWNVADLMYNCSISCKFVVDLYVDTYVIRSIYRFVAVICFVIDCSATTSEQQIEIHFLWISCRFIRDFVAQLAVQQIYTVSQKRPTYMACYNFDTHEQILIFLAEMLPIK